MAAEKTAPAAGASTALLRVAYVKSSIGYPQRQKETVRSLGLRHLGDVSLQPDNPAIRGMIRSVQHLVAVTSVAEADVRADGAS